MVPIDTDQMTKNGKNKNDDKKDISDGPFMFVWHSHY